MRMGWNVANMCGAKQRFTTKAEAKAAMKRTMTKHAGQTPGGAYRCKVCDYWHWGHRWNRPKKEWGAA